MYKALELAKIIRGNIGSNHLSLLEDYNLKSVFRNIYSIDASIEETNIIVCYIIYAYSPQSLWLDIKKDRVDNKISILNGLEADMGKDLFKDILYNKNEIINISIFDYLEQLKSWEWRAIFELLDYAAKMSRFAAKETKSELQWSELNNKSGEKETLTEEIDIKTIVSVNKEKGILLQQAIDKRKQADEMLEKIKKEYVNTDVATQADFGVTFTDTSTQRDIMSWRQHIIKRNEKRNAVR